MTVQEIHGQLRTRFGEAVGPLSEPKIDPFCLVACARLLEVSAFLRDGEGLELDFLQDLTAIDWPARSVIELVYHLYSFTHRHGIVLKVEADRAVPVVPSLEGIWKAANFLEREVYDLFGVTFTGHPDLRRILLPDDWVGHPLRKDYQEAGGYHGVSNERPDPLVELRRLDVKRIAEQTKPKPGDTPSGN